MSEAVTIEAKDAIEAFREFSKKAATAVEKALNTGAMMVERTAKESFKGRGDESVKGEPPRVDTGRLRASITHRLTEDDDGTFAEAGTNVEYALDVENGTSKTWPHPFMFPALAVNREEIIKMISKAVADA